MPQIIRSVTLQDIPHLIDLLLLDAADRSAEDATLWKVAKDAPAQIEKALTFALTAEQQPFRQIWQVAESEGRLTGVIHSMLVPVPPIYAGSQGAPGLILPEAFVVPDAPANTFDTLVAAAEDALRDAGARLLLSTYVPGKNWQNTLQDRGYEPLTLYLSRTHPNGVTRPEDVRLATEKDVPGIVARSAENRHVLSAVDPLFWDIHPEADTRFAAWMTRSLTLRDRDMFVTGTEADLEGYIIAQPASRLHFPPAHDIAATGVIDDYYHRELGGPLQLARKTDGAKALLRAAEASFVGRDVQAILVVCPAGWRSKIEVLTASGYKTALVWSIKR